MQIKRGKCMRDFQGEMFGRQTVPGKVRGKCPGRLSLGNVSEKRPREELSVRENVQE